jgi:hypothetical protein
MKCNQRKTQNESDKYEGKTREEMEMEQSMG